MKKRLILTLSMIGFLLVGSITAGDVDEFFISIPDSQGLFRYDATTQTLTLHSGPMHYPFYGQFAPDSVFYLPDSDADLVWRVETDGTRTILSQNGFLGRPATLLVNAANTLLCVTNNDTNNVTEIDLQTGDQRIVADNAAGLFEGPGGMEFSRDGSILFVTNVQGDDIVAVDPTTGVVSPFSDAAGLLDGPAALQLDGSRNLFCTNFDNNEIVRINELTGEAEVFVSDPLLQQANDLKYSKEGALYATVADISALVRVNALGEIEIIGQDFSVGKWFGVSFDRSFEFCEGRTNRYGDPTPGTGGVEPSYGMVFSPCLGAEVAFELEGPGGAPGFILWGLGSARIPAFGGELLVDMSGPFGLLPVVLPGSGELDILFEVPDLPEFDGFSLYEQLLFLDAGAPQGVAMSNGLEILFAR